MSLPNVKFNISNSGLGLLLADIQKLPGLVLTGATVVGANKVTVGNSYQIFSLEEAINLGIEQTGTNAFAYKEISDFYLKAQKGAELWFMVVVSTVTMADMADKDNAYANKLIADSGEKIRVLGISKKAGTTEVIANALDEDCGLAVIKAKALTEYYKERKSGVSVVISGNKFTGVVADLKDYTAAGNSNSKVSIFLSNNNAAKEASIGMALGVLASIPTQRKLSRIRNGAVEQTAAYFTNQATIESLNTSWDAIDAKGYIFLRSFPNRSGYYFTSDRTLTTPTDDFNSLARGLVMDEAVIIANDVLIEELSEEVPVTESGTIHPAILKGWQNAIEKQIKGLMVDTGKLSGVKAVIDENQNVLQTNNINIDLQLLPVGYSDFITVNIGFTTTLENNG